MIVDQSNLLHLTYCLNVHSGESFSDQWNAVKTHATKVRTSLNKCDQSFGLGLRLSATAVEELQPPGLAASFASWCDENNFYVYTINAFPYGTFHNAEVKADVYRPDWTRPERLSYTLAIADVLAQWLPKGVAGSISTVPLWFAPDYANEASRSNAGVQAVKHLIACAEYFENIFQKTGKDICLALEPEPWCALETTHDVISFFKHLDDEKLRRRIGVCVDTCHCALAFESPADVMDRLTRAGIRIPKIQLSAALSAESGNESVRDALHPFAEPVYFHQTAQRSGKSLNRWKDLSDALPNLSDTGETRVHFHVPLQWEGSERLRSTRGNMDEAFWKSVRSGVCDHLEIETYTFDVLPNGVSTIDLCDSVVEEYKWVLGKLGIPNL